MPPKRDESAKIFEEILSTKSDDVLEQICSSASEEAHQESVLRRGEIIRRK